MLTSETSELVSKQDEKSKGIWHKENEKSMSTWPKEIDKKDPTYGLNTASQGKRFLNWVIDLICIYILNIIIAWLFWWYDESTYIDEWSWQALWIGVLLLYYCFFETVFSKTPWKRITKTKVVDIHWKSLGFLHVLGRSVCRFIPFDALSFLWKNAIWWHDTLSNTRVIIDRKVSNNS